MNLLDTGISPQIEAAKAPQVLLLQHVLGADF